MPDVPSTAPEALIDAVGGFIVAYTIELLLSCRCRGMFDFAFAHVPLRQSGLWQRRFARLSNDRLWLLRRCLWLYLPDGKSHAGGPDTMPSRLGMICCCRVSVRANPPHARSIAIPATGAMFCFLRRHALSDPFDVRSCRSTPCQPSLSSIFSASFCPKRLASLINISFRSSLSLIFSHVMAKLSKIGDGGGKRICLRATHGLTSIAI